MAVETKPLFHPEVMRQQVRSFNLPERVTASQPKLRQWADLIASSKCRPLGRVSTGKKVAVPNSSLIGFKSPLPRSAFCNALLEPVISSFDSGR